jgi:hypothetical protein
MRPAGIFGWQQHGPRVTPSRDSDSGLACRSYVPGQRQQGQRAGTDQRVQLFYPAQRTEPPQPAQVLGRTAAIRIR